MHKEVQKLERDQVEEIITLTPMQEGILFHYLMDPESDMYHENLSLELRGDIHFEIFEKAWRFVVESNQMLRTVYRWKQVSHPIQIVLKEYMLPIEFVDLSESNLQNQNRREVLEEVKRNRFDLQEVPFKVLLCKRAANQYTMIVSNHHIIFDGWSTGILLKQFFLAYESFIHNTTPARPISSKFKQFILLQESQDRQAHSAYWKEHLNNIEPSRVLRLKSYETHTDKGSGCSKLQCTQVLLPAIQQFLGKNEVTFASFIYTVWGIVLQRYLGTNDIVFGITMSGRDVKLSGIEEMVGLCINTVPLRIQMEDEESALGLVKRVGRDIRGHNEYLSLGLVDIKAQSGLTDEHPLFQSIVVVENYPLDRIVKQTSGSFFVESFDMDERNNFDLSLSVSLDDCIKLKLDYNRSLLDADNAERLLENVQQVISDLLRYPSKCLNEIVLLTPDEKRKVIVDFNGTKVSYLNDTIHALFEQQVEKTPDLIAVEEDGKYLTYRELNDSANQVARLLRDQGVTTQSLVGIMMDCSMQMVIGCLAILKAGAAYLPIDPASPKERIQYIVRDSGTNWLLVRGNLASVVPFDGSVINLDDEGCYKGSTANLQYGPPQHLAYCIYTSGTTGNPKGVLVEHGNVVNYLSWAKKKYVKHDNSNFALYTSLGFDLTVTSLYTPLISGHSVVVYNGENKGLLLERMIDENKVGVIKLTPSHLKLIRHKNAPQSNVKVMIIGGEDLDTTLARDIYNNFNGQVELLNEYGPTETTVGCMLYTYDPADDTSLSVPIGSPADNVCIYLLDKYLQPVPEGVLGEIYISGDGIARGYLNKPELTSERFVENPFKYTAGYSPHTDLMYRTGDYAIMSRGSIVHYKGRTDNQIKMNGYRIELGEIENQLLTHKDITNAAVVVEQDTDAEKRLIAYYSSQTELSPNELRAHLKARLHSYMVPAHYIHLEVMPLTINGKINKKRLPKPKMIRPLRQEGYVEAVTSTEKSVATIWEEVIGSQVGIHDKFFDIGGNSLNAIRIASKLEVMTGKEISVTALFHYPTVYELSRYIEQLENQSGDEETTNEPDIRNEPELASSDIAIIGMSGRFPGAKDVRQFWSNLENGVESISFFTDEELIESGIDPELIKQSNYVKAKGIVESAECFDAAFFEYSPGEAEVMEPQLKMLYECTWEAMEDAGYNIEGLTDTVGLFVGATTNIERIIQVSQRIDDSLSEQFSIGALNDMYTFSTRISYKLNLKGPAISLSTACSTSLVAVHMACRAISNGDCDMALAGGASIISPIKSGYLYQPGMVKSPDGHCRAFDADANGVVGGDGAGVVALKSLDLAIADGDHIYAVIKGSAVNNDGDRKAGYSAPSAQGQTDVIKAALRAAKVDPETIDYIETHGTGTAIGDPIEIEALTKAFGPIQAGSCRIGSVKTNIGHLDAAAGIAGLIKTVLALKEEKLPPSLHYTRPNPNINFSKSPFYVNASLTEWKRGERPRRAGVSSFGIGGTNCHVILEEAPIVKASVSKDSSDWNTMVLSAKSPEALDRMTENLAQYLKENNDVNLSDVAFTLQTGRKAFAYKRMFVCRDVKDALQSLEPVSELDGQKQYDERRLYSYYSDSPAKRIVFMFPGHGAEYVQMGRDLFELEPVFRKHIEHCFELMRSVASFEANEVMYPESSLMEEAERKLRSTEFAQPVLFAFEYALSKLLMSWGIKPDALIGYSFGEYVAACLSGVFSLEDAIKLIIRRGQLMQQIPLGAMLSVPLTAQEVKPLLMDEISLSVDNGTSCIVAGSEEAIALLEREMKVKKLLCMRVNISHAGHSLMMDSILSEYDQAVRSITLNQPKIPFISTITGDWLRHDEAMDPCYWVRQMRETVRFAKGIQQLAEIQGTLFVEIGPGRDLSILANRFIQADRRQYALDLVRVARNNHSDIPYLYNKIGRLWMLGAPIDWTAVKGDFPRERVVLPTYPFERKFYGLTTRADAKAKPSHIAAGKKGHVNQWLYTSSWRQNPLLEPIASDSGLGDRWIIFADDYGLGEFIAEKLQADNSEVILVRQGYEFTLSTPCSFVINPNHKADYIELMKEIVGSADKSYKIIHLWGVTAGSKSQTYAEQVQKAQALGLYSLMYLTQAIEELVITKSVLIAAVTDNMQDVAGEMGLYPEKATVLGACLTISQEYPHIKCGNIDICDISNEKWRQEKKSAAILREMKAGLPTFAVAYRNNCRWIKMYEPFEPLTPPVRPAELRDQGVYVIFGGLGHIGMLLASHMAKKVQARLVLLGRSMFPPQEEWKNWIQAHGEDDNTSRKIRKLERIIATGSSVEVIRANVSDMTEIKNALDQIECVYGQVNGIVYAAGITGEKSFTTISETDPTVCEEHFQSKMYGVIALQQILDDKELDFCMFTSSLSPILGGIGFMAYSAANLFMDAFIRKHNREHKVPWLCVNLDGWERPEHESYNTAVGSTLVQMLIKPEEGMEVFDTVLPLKELGQIIVSTGELQERIDKWVHMQISHDLTSNQNQTATRVQVSAPFVLPRNQLEAYIVDIFKSFFGIEKIGVDDDFFELGGDSLKAISIVSKIQKEMGYVLPVADFFKNSTAAKVAEYVKTANRNEDSDSILPAEDKPYYSLSSAQQRLYVMYEMNPEGTSYNETSAYVMNMDLDMEKVQQIFRKLIDRHESFRTSFHIVNDEIVQRIAPTVDFQIELAELNQENSKQWIKQFIRPFDLAHAPLLRVGLIKQSEKKFIIVVDLHHIIADAISFDRVIQDFFDLYSGKELEPLSIQYKDYCEWINNADQQERINKQREFWLKEFAEPAPVLQLKTDFSRPPVSTFIGGVTHFTIDQELTSKLKALSSELKTTLYTTLLSVFVVLLEKQSSQHDIVIGSPVSGRQLVELEPIVGMFVNMLAIRSYPHSNKNFSQLVEEVKQTVFLAIENQEYPFDELVRRLEVQRSLNRNPLFDVVFSMQNMDAGSMKTEGIYIEPLEIEKNRSPFDLVLTATPSGDTIMLQLEYSVALFQAASAEAIVRYYEEIIRQIVDNPNVSINEISLSHNLLTADVEVSAKEYIEFGF